MSALRKATPERPLEVPVDELRPGHIVGASGIRTIVSDGIDHGTYRTFVVRYTNGETRAESWDNGSTVLVIGRDREVVDASKPLRLVRTTTQPGP